MDEKERRQQLADFLTKQRERLSPGKVGLGDGYRRRRVKGLRREDVAEMAEISTTWYTWLEQGRDIRLSQRALARLAEALQLNDSQRHYLITLAMPELAASTSPVVETISPTLRRIVDSQGTIPAYVIDHQWRYVAWNQATLDVFGPIDQIPFEARNAVRMFFSDVARQLMADWDRHARRILAEFRADSARYVGEPWLTQLIKDLQASSPEFRKWWPDHDVRWVPDWTKVVCHTLVGDLVLEQATFLTDENPSFRLFLYMPKAGTRTAEKLQDLAARGVQWQFTQLPGDRIGLTAAWREDSAAAPPLA